MEYPKFIKAFFSAGIATNPEPLHQQKRMTHVIEDLVIVKGNIENLKNDLKEKSQLKKSRIVWLNKDSYLVIKYQSTVKNVSERPIWEIGIKTMEELSSLGEEWKVVKTLDLEEVLSEEEGLFPAGNFFGFLMDDVTDDDSLNKIFELGGQFKEEESYFLVFRDQKNYKGNPLDFYKTTETPLNELHLYQIKDKNRLKIQNNYNMISKIFLKRENLFFTFIARKRIPLERINFKSQIIDTYPLNFKKISQNSIPLIFPEGLKITAEPQGKRFSSTYLSVDVDTTDKYILTFLKFYERVEELQLEILNKRNFTHHESIYIEKAIAVISTSHDIDNQKKILEIIFGHFQLKQKYPIEKLISSLVQDIPILPHKQVIYSLKTGPSTRQIRMKDRPEVPTLSKTSLKTMFKILKIESIVQIFKNILYEKGIFLIGKNRIVGFHIIESLSQLLFPFKWILPKIASYSLNYNFFDSPLPLIYFVRSDKFRQDKIKGKNLIGKCLVYLEANIVDSGPGETPDLPKKAVKRLIQRLEMYAGCYNKFYTEECPKDFRNSQFDIEHCQEKFDYWGVRDSFLEFMQEVTKNYQKCIELTKYKENLHFSQIFNSENFFKEMKFLKAKKFLEKFMATNMFAKFIESRIECESKEQENFINFFDILGRQKRSKKMLNLLENLLGNHRGEYHCKQINPTESNCKKNSKIFLKGQFLYKGKFPKMDEEFLSTPQNPSKIQKLENWRIMQTFASERDFQFMKEKEWTKTFLEAIQTLWYVSLEIFVQTKKIRIKNEIYLFSCKKLWKLKDDKYFINSQILLSISFLSGYFEDDETFNKIQQKFKKNILKLNLKCALIAKFYSGNRTRKRFDDEYFKQKSPEKKIEKPKIPKSISTHFETNEFCAQCNIYIPEEFIFSMFDRSLKTIKIDCPNKNCNNRFEPKFNFVQLKVKGQADMDDRRSLRLISPIRLVKKINEFLMGCDPEGIFYEEKSGSLYWNLLFYFNLTSLPGFFMEKEVNREVFNFSIVYLDNYYVSQQFKKRFGDKTRIPTSKSMIKDTENSFGNMSSGRSGGDKEVKFSSKKDFIKRLGGYDDRLKKAVPKDTLKALFPYCEHLRNFEFKYNMFQKYSDFVQNFEPMEIEKENMITEDMIEGLNFSSGFNRFME